MALLAQDTFTVGVDTVLESHTPDIGTGWSVETAAKLTCDAAGDYCYANQANNTRHWGREGTSIGADAMDVTVDILVNNVNNNRFCGPAGRMTTANWGNQYNAEAQGGGIGGNVQLTYFLFKAVSSVRTQLGSWADTSTNNGASTHTVKLEIRTAAKKVFVDGIERISSADDSLAGNHYAGLTGQRLEAQMDNFKSESVNDPLPSKILESSLLQLNRMSEAAVGA